MNFEQWTNTVFSNRVGRLSFPRPVCHGIGGAIAGNGPYCELFGRGEGKTLGSIAAALYAIKQGIQFVVVVSADLQHSGRMRSAIGAARDQMAGSVPYFYTEKAARNSPQVLCVSILDRMANLSIGVDGAMVRPECFIIDDVVSMPAVQRSVCQRAYRESVIAHDIPHAIGSNNPERIVEFRGY